jgi:pimeloyl-ACP methyl ester carboxylesterase
MIGDSDKSLDSTDASGGVGVRVGQSYGGLIVRLYARTYPDDVSGLVLVDALAEGLQDAETPAQWAIQRKLIENEVPENWSDTQPLKGSTLTAALTSSAIASIPSDRNVSGPAVEPSTSINDRGV